MPLGPADLRRTGRAYRTASCERAPLALARLAAVATADAGLDLRPVPPVGVAGSDTAELAGVGDVGRAHRLAVRVEVVRGRTYATAPRRIVGLPGAGERRLALRLGRRAGGLLARRGSVTISVTVEQRVGTGIRTKPGAFSGDSIVFGRP